MAVSDSFVHLHVHSHFSLLDGACRLEDLVARTKELGMSALALTDHGNLYGLVQFVQAAQAADIKPIIGYEAYVAPGARTARDSGGMREAAFHLTLLAETDAGCRNLLHLATTAFLDGFYYKPRIDKDVLAQHADGLIGLSGCLKGEIPHLLAAGASDDALAVGRQYLEILGKDNFFIELQDNGIDDQTRILAPLSELAHALGVSTAATNDIHYMHAEDARVHDVLLCINTGKTLADAQRMRFQTEQFFYRTPDEMRQLFSRYPDALDTTARIADRCNASIDFKTTHFPNFTPPMGKQPAAFLRELCEEGFRKKYPAATPEARQRLDYELGVIDQKGYNTYFLIVWDFVRFCREHRIPAGARGSGCSSLVGYCLGISTVDPLRYGLMFERFLDPERREMPDFDIDICEKRRGEVIDYVRSKYGADNVAQIITFGTLGAKAAIRDVGRAMGLPPDQVAAISKKVPSAPRITIEEAFDREPELQTLCDNDPQVRELFEVARKIQRLNRHASTHAAGVVIADRPLTEYTALCRPGGTEVTTQWPMNDVAAVGLLKMDLLGLRTLTIVQTAVDLVRATTDKDLDIDAVPLDDPKTFDLFRRAETNGVFQFGSSGIRALLRELRPDRLEDLIVANALYRPGPLGGGVVEEFIRRKHNPTLITYEHPILEECLAESCGIMATQEQVMLIVHRLAGLSMSRALSLMKAISKKKTGDIESTRGDFLDGAVRNGVPRSLAERIFELIVFFGGYGFNRAHATAYALLAYRTAYLKAHHPVEFMAATLTCESGDVETVVRYVDEARRMNIDVLPPSINHSDIQFTVQEGKIRYGLGAIKGVGEKAAQSVVDTRRQHGPFKNFYDFVDSVDLHAVNRQVVETLIKCGAFDTTGARRSQLAAVVDAAFRIGVGVQQDRERGQMGLFGRGDPEVERNVLRTLPNLPEWSENLLLASERETLGLYISRHPLARHERLLGAYSTLAVKDVPSAEDGTPVLIGGLVEGLRTTVTKTGRAAGKKMARFTLEDLTGAVPCVMFAEDYQRDERLIQPAQPIFVRGLVSHRMGDPSIRVTDVVPFDQARARFTASVILSLKRGAANDSAFAELKSALERHRGRAHVFLELPDDGGRTIVLETGSDLWIAPTDECIRELAALLGDENVRLNPTPDRAKPERTRSWAEKANRNGPPARAANRSAAPG